MHHDILIANFGEYHLCRSHGDSLRAMQAKEVPFLWKKMGKEEKNILIIDHKQRAKQTKDYKLLTFSNAQ